MSFNGSRCIRVGYPPDELDDESTNLRLSSIPRNLASRHRRHHEAYSHSSLVTVSELMVSVYWLRQESTGVREHATGTIAYALDFAFGRWRDEIPSGSNGKSPPDRAWWDANWSWRRELEASLFCGSFIGAWDELKRIAEWLRDDVRLDIEQSKEDRAWLLIVAGVLKDRPWEEMGKWVTRIEQSHRKRERLLLAVLRAIVSSNQSDFDKALTAHFARYRRSELRSGLQSGNVMAFVDTIGTFLVHLAERNGLKANVPENMIDHIVRV